MTTAVQASHRPLTGRRAAGGHPPTSFGVLYPEGEIIGVIDDYAEAVNAAIALRDGGVPLDDIDLLEGRDFVTLRRAVARRRGLLGRLGVLVSRLFSDDAATEQRLFDEAARGHALLAVHAVDAPVVERVSATLIAHHAHDVSRYHRAFVEELF